MQEEWTCGAPCGHLYFSQGNSCGTWWGTLRN